MTEEVEGEGRRLVPPAPPVPVEEMGHGEGVLLYRGPVRRRPLGARVRIFIRGHWRVVEVFLFGVLVVVVGLACWWVLERAAPGLFQPSTSKDTRWRP